jgi:small subunit ribosomal protein S17e
LTNDFHINKKILSEVAKVPTKSLRNKIAGFATHLVKRIQRGPVKGISLKVQEEERERRLDWVPKESEINISKVFLSLCRFSLIKRLLI